jgi:hypothetical protein
MINHYLRRSIRVLVPVLVCVLCSGADAQQRVISDAEAAYLQAQQGKPLPQRPKAGVAEPTQAHLGSTRVVLLAVPSGGIVQRPSANGDGPYV